MAVEKAPVWTFPTNPKRLGRWYGKGPADRSPVGPGPAAARRASSAMVPVRRSAGHGTWKRTASCERKTDRSATRRMVPSVSGARAGSRTRCHWEIVRGVACRARAGARPEDRTRRCSVIHHWASSDAGSAPAVTAFLRRRATAMATPAAASAAAAAAMP